MTSPDSPTVAGTRRKDRNKNRNPAVPSTDLASDLFSDLAPDTSVDTSVAAFKPAPRLVRLAVLLAALGCLVGMGWALTLHQEAKAPDDIAIERVTPPPASEAVPGQTPVIIDLAFGFNLELAIDGEPVPPAQIVEVESLGQFTFAPGPGKFTERFTNGQHIAQIVYWPKTGDRTTGASIYQWTFRVV